MQKYWESTQKNVFSELLSFLGRMAQENLTQQIEYLKVENEILRKRAGRSIRPTPVERRKLIKFGTPLGKDLRNIISIVRYETFAENWINTIKRECLNHFVVFGERHLRYPIKEYVEHYNTTRPHSSMDNLPLEYIPRKSAGKIRCQPKLGGIIRHYYGE